jgi:hypothetical protein
MLRGLTDTRAVAEVIREAAATSGPIVSNPSAPSVPPAVTSRVNAAFTTAHKAAIS